MATFEVQIEGMTQIPITTSSAPTQDEVTEFLKDGIKDVTNKLVKLNPTEAFKFGTESTVDTNAGITINGQILSVVRENGNATDLRQATPIPSDLRYLATDKNSLHYRSAYNPAFYLLNSKLHVLPDPTDANNSAIVSHINYATVGSGDVSINNFPDEYEQLVVLYASAMSCMAAASDIQNNMPTKATSPNNPSFIVDGVVLPSTPVYTGPSLDYSLDKINTRLSEEDLEMAEKEMDKLDKNLEKFKAEGDDANIKFQESMEIFKTDLDRLTKNADRDTQMKATEYRSELYKHQQDIGQFTSEVQEKLAKYKWYAEQYMMLMNQYNSQLAVMMPQQNLPKEQQQKSRKG